ncbi:MAG TPA: amidohydrolase family protein [Bauldia sp.]|nr:amidohydrolase family protein [Bauldia sp.]
MRVDAAMHPVVTKSSDLRTWLKEPWRSTGLPEAVNRDLMRPKTPWYAEGSKPASGFAGSDPKLARRVLLEEGDLDYVVLLPLTRGMMPNLRREVATAAATNEWLAATWLSPEHNPDGRFKGTIRIVPRSPRDAIVEIERWAGHPHFVQVGVPLATHLPYGRQEYLPVWEAAARHGLPVAVHDDGGGIGIEFPPTCVGYPTTFIEAFSMRPFNAAIQLSSLICEGVFEQVKDLVFVFADGSFDVAGPMLWRLDKDWKAARSDIPWTEHLPSSYLKDHVRFVLQRWDGPGGSDDLAKALDIWNGAELVMYASNYPHWDYLPPQGALADLPGQTRDAIMGGNAAKLYRLNQAAAPEMAEHV